MGYDLVIRGGVVVDGTGLARRRADVAIEAGRIAAIGHVAGDRTLPWVTQAEGPDVICYASDYYHWDSVFPDSVKILAERTDLDAHARSRLFAGNAARLYRLPLPETGNSYA